MAQEFSFDMVSEVDLQAMDNAVNTTNREIANRFDFKGSVSRITLDKKENDLTFYSDNEGKLKSVVDIFQTRSVKQGISLQAFSFEKIEAAEGGTVRQKVKITQGMPSEKAKAIIRMIKDSKIKVTASLQGEQIRVAGRSKDDLQSVISFLKSRDLGLPVQFVNYR